MIRKFQRQDLEAAVKIWLAANKEAHDFIDPCYWEGYKDAVKEMFLQAEIYVFETEDMMEEIFDEIHPLSVHQKPLSLRAPGGMGSHLYSVSLPFAAAVLPEHTDPLYVYYLKVLF